MDRGSDSQKMACASKQAVVWEGLPDGIAWHGMAWQRREKPTGLSLLADPGRGLAAISFAQHDTLSDCVACFATTGVLIAVVACGRPHAYLAPRRRSPPLAEGGGPWRANHGGLQPLVDAAGWRARRRASCRAGGLSGSSRAAGRQGRHRQTDRRMGGSSMDGGVMLG